MTVQGMTSVLRRAESFDAALAHADATSDFSVVDGLRVPLLAALLDRRRANDATDALLVITATSREAEAVERSFRAVAPDTTVVMIPAWETLPHERLSPSAETVGARLSAFRALHEWDGSSSIVAIASVRAALQPVADNLLSVEPVRLVAGERSTSLEAIASTLVDLAYTRVDLVSRRGEFAVRGGILDVFPPQDAHPVRVDFFGDEVEQIREFSVADQRSTPETIREVLLPPSRELLLTADVRARAKRLGAEYPNLQSMLERVGEGIAVEGMESLSPVLAERLVPITEYLPAGAAVAVLSPERVATRAVSLSETNREFLEAAWSAATVGARAPISLESGDFLSVSAVYESFTGGDAAGPWWTLSEFQQGPDDEIDVDSMLAQRVLGDPVPSFQGNVEGALSHVAELLRSGWHVAVAFAGDGTRERAASVLAERGVAGRRVDVLPEVPDEGVVYLVKGELEAGFVQPEVQLFVASETEFYGRSVGYQSGGVRKLASRRKNVVDPLALTAGDYVVHQTHGIGRFVEMTQREVSTGGRNAQKSKRDYLVLEYASSKRGGSADKLLVPTDQLDLLSRYVGGEAPQLSRMGGSDWSHAKSKARRAVRDIAVELVKLYSARMAAQGHAFGADTPWQRELEEAFPYAETVDQLQTIDEVKADMEKPVPMDRLLSGDVGFGKTEVAVRAAFKAIQDGKQVAMIVPTTLLVRQHLETFTERFAGFPVRVRPLSRFQSDKEARQTVADLTSGAVDMVIGTHRVLTDDVVFKDLGLVIIDEEQRFGVQHKDKLKTLKTNVDVLAMSATPIPRTLEMAVTGIREMSTLATAPEERHPILSFVGPRNDKQIQAAIRRELLREGQVFFVHNRVQSINRVARELSELVPEARIAVAHGKLAESTLEQIVVDFWERKFDVLVATTIIETGLDISNANTIIIDSADKYGLSQLHQLRGRVGRGRERAYAYFLYDPARPLTELATDRLSTIAANNELGSGMQVALKDLEIRGAGNLLGGEQAGHIAGVGFDLYLRMVGEAVSAFKGEDSDGPAELRLEVPIEAHIPDDYIDSERLRLEAYQKLSAASVPTAAEGQIDLVVEELTDRYGDLPDLVASLVRIARLRQRVQRSGISEFVVMGTKLRIAPVDLPDSLQARLRRLYPTAKLMTQAEALLVPLPETAGEVVHGDDLLEWVWRLLDALFPVEADSSAASAQPDRTISGV